MKLPPHTPVDQHAMFAEPCFAFVRRLESSEAIFEDRAF